MIGTRLKLETKGAHEATEGAIFNIELMKGTLPLEGYARLLYSFQLVLTALEEELDNCTDERVKAVWDLCQKKVPLLDKDLSSKLLTCSEPKIPKAIDGICKQWILEIQATAALHPAMLLGILYVFEGSTLGGKVIKKKLAERIQGEKENEGLNYLSVYGNSVGRKFGMFIKTFNELEFTEEEQEFILKGANITFRNVGTVQNQIYKFIHSNEDRYGS